MMKITMVLAVSALMMLVILCRPVLLRVRRLQEKDAALSRQIQRFSRENRRLSEEIKLLKSDALYIEEMARDELKVARENEIVLRIIGDEEEDKR